MKLEEKMRSLGDKGLEVKLLSNCKIDGLIARVTWYDPNSESTFWIERVIRFEELRELSVTVSTDSTFEFNLSNILDNMAAKVLERVEYYKNNTSDEYAIY